MKNNEKIKSDKYVVLIIGVSQYKEENRLNDIPNIESNVLKMKEMFLDKRLFGIKESNLIFSYNEDLVTINRKIVDAACKAKNNDFTLLVYYTGHGVISSENFKLYLATSNTTKKYLESDAISLAWLSETVKRSVAGRKIIILDACYSGRLHNTMGSSDNVNALISSYNGIHFVSSTSEYEPSLYNTKNSNEPTYFTAGLLERIHKGLNNHRNYLTLKEIVDDIRTEFASHGKPLPAQSFKYDIDKMPFVVNAFVSEKEFEVNEIETESKDKSFWIEAENENSTEVYQQYLRLFPYGKYVELANKRIIDLKYKAINRVRKPLFATVALVSVFFFTALMPSSVNDGKIPEKILVAGFNKSVDKKKLQDDKVLKFSDKTPEQKADQLSCDEMHYNAALKIYQKLAETSFDQKLIEKIDNLKFKIETKYNDAIYKAEIFRNADGGLEDAKRMYQRALVFKPADTKAISALTELDSL